MIRKFSRSQKHYQSVPNGRKARSVYIGEEKNGQADARFF